MDEAPEAVVDPEAAGSVAPEEAEAPIPALLVVPALLPAPAAPAPPAAPEAEVVVFPLPMARAWKAAKVLLPFVGALMAPTIPALQ